MKIAAVCALASITLSLNTIAAPLPFVVEAQVDSSSYAITPNGLSGPVSWTPPAGDFSFNVFGMPAVATISNAYRTSGSYSTLADSDLLTTQQTISWSLGSGQIGFDGVFEWDGRQTDFIVVWNVTSDGFTTTYTPTDVDGDGTAGFKLVNGTFQGLNFRINAVTSVPEPSTWGYLLAGLALVGWVGRRKSQ